MLLLPDKSSTEIPPLITEATADADPRSVSLRQNAALKTLLILQFSQALLQAVDVRDPVFALAAAGAALQELHLHGQLAELEVLALFPQIHAAPDRAVL